MAARGVFTNVFREKLAQLSAGSLIAPTQEQMAISWFAVGEGGYQVVGSRRLPKVPDASRTSLEATIPSTNVGGESSTGCIFTKALDPSAVSISGSDVEVVCVLDAIELDLDEHSHLTGNLGGDPILFEIGLYDGDPSVGPATLLAYCTFDEIVKTSGRRVQLTLNIRY